MTGRRTLILVLLALFVVAGMFLWKNPVSVARKSAGTTGLDAPEFALKTLDGSRLTLSEYRGKVILLDFWATWCSPCQEEIPRFVEWQGKYGNQGFQVIGISMDDNPKPVQGFVQDFRMRYPVAMGTQEMASQFGGILGLPVNLVIGRDGKIKAKHLGMYDLNQLEQEIKTQLDSQ